MTKTVTIDFDEYLKLTELRETLDAKVKEAEENADKVFICADFTLGMLFPSTSSMWRRYAGKDEVLTTMQKDLDKYRSLLQQEKTKSEFIRAAVAESKIRDRLKYLFSGKLPGVNLAGVNLDPDQVSVVPV